MEVDSPNYKEGTMRNCKRNPECLFDGCKMFVSPPSKNTDKEIWRKYKDDFYSPSIHVTERGEIGINVGGYVTVASVEDWHKAKQPQPDDLLENIRGAVARGWCANVNAHKNMDLDLAEAITQEIWKLLKEGK